MPRWEQRPLGIWEVDRGGGGGGGGGGFGQDRAATPAAGANHLITRLTEDPYLKKNEPTRRLTEPNGAVPCLTGRRVALMTKAHHRLHGPWQASGQSTESSLLPE